MATVESRLHFKIYFLLFFPLLHFSGTDQWAAQKAKMFKPFWFGKKEPWNDSFNTWFCVQRVVPGDFLRLLQLQDAAWVERIVYIFKKQNKQILKKGNKIL